MICFRPFIIVLVFLGVNCVVFGKDGDDLKAVVVLFRHGDRSPLSSWPNDVYFGDSSLWPDGYGQLNNFGKERHYKLGQWFRERYDGFLPRRYNRSDIYVRSTDVDRTLMSAASNLAGLYPPEGDQVWNSAIPWQAIPIHSCPLDQDPILAVHKQCSKHDQLLQQLKNSEEIQTINQNYADFYKTFSELAGYNTLKSFEIFGGLVSTISIYKKHNLELPKWIDYYWPNIQTLSAKSFQLNTYTQDLARLRTGPFFDYLLSYINSFKNPTSVVPKFLMLSAHDTTVADRTNAMGVYANVSPKFSATIIWEIKNDSKGLYVNMFYKNSSDFVPLVLPGCDFDCGVEEFGRILEPITATVEQWEQECNYGQ